MRIYQQFQKNPKVIITAISQWHSEKFKIWAAEKIGTGSRLLIMQHGGTYGTTSFNFGEEHEKEIADEYLVWGWGGSEKKMKNIPVHIINKASSSLWNPKGNLYIIATSIKPQLYLSQMNPNKMWCENGIIYANQVKKLVSSLLEHTATKLIFRGKPGEALSNDYFLNLISDKKLELSKNKFLHKELVYSKLAICTYSGTPFIECMSLNRPCVLLWDKRTDPLRSKAVEYFDELIKSKICHTSVQSLCKHIQLIENDIDSWWNQDQVVEVRSKFINKYAYNKEKISDSLIKIIKDNIKSYENN